MCALASFVFPLVGATRSAVVRVTPPREGQGEAPFVCKLPLFQERAEGEAPFFILQIYYLAVGLLSATTTYGRLQKQSFQEM